MYYNLITSTTFLIHITSKKLLPSTGYGNAFTIVHDLEFNTF